jgi:amino acid adenylation domain-containing protein
MENVETSIPARFESIARLYPERLAVKDGGQSLTYDQLNRAANLIAHAVLSQRGATSEPIPLLFQHGIDMFPAILGVLKAGKFYLGLDPSLPDERQARMLADSGASLLLSNSRGERLANPKLRRSMGWLNVDQLDQSIAADNPGLSIEGEDPACLLYTSGSTGTPKGIVCPHKNIVFNGVVHGRINKIGVDDKLTLFHSIAFGSSHINLYQSLLNGASIYPFDISTEGVDRIPHWLLEEQITCFHSTPAVFRQFAQSLPVGMNFSALRLINLSGAPVSNVEIELYRKHFPARTTCEISIGSTETHTFASFLIDQDFKLPAEGVPVGYPRPGREILIVGEDGNIAQPGQTGEITVRTRYLNRPFRRPSSTTLNSHNADETLFPTGDLGRMLPDGFVIHLGRKDLMVKIRGFRVELGEIERALLAHPQVKDAGVTAWNRELGEEYLVGYIVARPEAVLNVSDLKNFIRSKLPDYMVPSTFVFMDSLPLTNGKLDRRSLPKPDRGRPKLAVSYAAPQNETQSTLVQVWEDVLDVRPIGIHDNFFDLGGHSLTANRVVYRVIHDFQLAIPLRAIFESPTVQAMAAVISAHRGKTLDGQGLMTLLDELESLSDDEAQRLVIEEQKDPER